MEAVAFASEIGLPLRPSNSALTMAFDDHDGKRSALVREGLKKVLHRRGVLWAGVWVRECKAQTNVTHDHLLFHLPPSLCTGAGLQQLEVSILRLVGLHGGGVTHQNAVKLTFYLNGADGRYLLGEIQAPVVMASDARPHLRQTVRCHSEPRASSSPSLADVKRTTYPTPKPRLPGEESR